DRGHAALTCLFSNESGCYVKIAATLKGTEHVEDRRKPEQVIAKLREVEVDLSKGTPAAAAVKKIAVKRAQIRWAKSRVYGRKNRQNRRTKPCT
ncbi:MAG: hypothetical protein JWM57_2770, partial [Phycisphaerales bacterium]|nr:hypothetical protein [Phycisphaerales bacterium]